MDYLQYLGPPLAFLATYLFAKQRKWGIGVYMCCNLVLFVWAIHALAWGLAGMYAGLFVLNTRVLYYWQGEIEP